MGKHPGLQGACAGRASWKRTGDVSLKVTQRTWCEWEERKGVDGRCGKNIGGFYRRVLARLHHKVGG